MLHIIFFIHLRFVWIIFVAVVKLYITARKLIVGTWYVCVCNMVVRCRCSTVTILLRFQTIRLCNIRLHFYCFIWLFFFLICIRIIDFRCFRLFCYIFFCLFIVFHRVWCIIFFIVIVILINVTCFKSINYNFFLVVVVLARSYCPKNCVAFFSLIMVQ